MSEIPPDIQEAMFVCRYVGAAEQMLDDRLIRVSRNYSDIIANSSSTALEERETYQKVFNQIVHSITQQRKKLEECSATYYLEGYGYGVARAFEGILGDCRVLLHSLLGDSATPYKLPRDNKAAAP